MASFEPFARVRLRGLSRPELNGAVVTVLPADDEAEAQKLAETGRVKVSHYPKPLALQPERLERAPAPDFCTPPLPFTALQIVRREAAVVGLCVAAAECGEDLRGLGSVGELDEPEGFAETLWLVYGSVPPAGALPPDLHSVILDTPGHWLYWVGLEQVGHHFLIEACDGVWRGYQALARGPCSEGSHRPFETFGGVLVEANRPLSAGGYAASDWARPEPPQRLAEPSAHELWGGGRDLARAEVSQVLDLVRSLQAQAQLLAGRLRPQAGAPAEDDAAVAAWARACLEGAALSVTPDRPGSPRALPGYAEADAVWIFSAPGAEPQCDLSLPSRLAFPFMVDFAKLTGEYPSGRAFLQVLECVGWESLAREDGGSVGWTLRALDLRSQRLG